MGRRRSWHGLSRRDHDTRTRFRSFHDAEAAPVRALPIFFLTMLARASRRSLRVVLVPLLLVAGCGDAAERSFVGEVAGTDALVAVVVDGSQATAYVCDGVPGETGGRRAAIQAWFTGRSDGQRAELLGSAGDRLVVTLTGSAMSGTLTLAGGRSLPVTGGPVTGPAGLYRGENDGVPPGLAGWIVAADGTQRGGTIGIRANEITSFRLSRPLVSSEPAPVVSKRVQGSIPSPLTSADFDSVSHS